MMTQSDEYLLLKRSVRNITNGKAFSIPWIIHEYTEQGTNNDFLKDHAHVCT